MERDLYKLCLFSFCSREIESFISILVGVEDKSNLTVFRVLLYWNVNANKVMWILDMNILDNQFDE